MFRSFGILGFIWVAIWVFFYRDNDVVDDPEMLLRPTVSMQINFSLSHSENGCIIACYFLERIEKCIVFSVQEKDSQINFNKCSCWVLICDPFGSEANS